MLSKRWRAGLIGVAWLTNPYYAVSADTRPVLRADLAAGATGGAKISTVYHSPQCASGCTIDATRLTSGEDLDLNGFDKLDNIYIHKPVILKLGAGEYRLRGSIIFRGNAIGQPGTDIRGCEGVLEGKTCVVDGMGLVGQGRDATRIRFTNGSGPVDARRYIQALGVFAPATVPDLFGSGTGDRRVASSPIRPGDSNLTVADPAQLTDIAPGSWILVGNMHHNPTNGATDFQQVEWKQVAAISGAVVKVTEPFRNTYNNIGAPCSATTEGCDRGYWFAMTGVARNVVIADLTISEDLPAAKQPAEPATGVYLSGVIGPKLRDLRIEMAKPARGRSFELRMYRTLQPAVDGFDTPVAPVGIEISHTLYGTFRDFNLGCGAKAGGYSVSIDFGSQHNLFENNSLACARGFLIVEADANSFRGNRIGNAAESNSSLPPIAGTAGIAVYGGRDTVFDGNIVRGTHFGTYVGGALMPASPQGTGTRLWQPRTRFSRGACVQPPTTPWLFFCATNAGISGPTVPDFARASPGGAAALQPLRDGDGTIWLFAGSLHVSGGVHADNNRFTNVREPKRAIQ